MAKRKPFALKYRGVGPLALLLIPLAALVLEVLPFGVRMIFTPSPERRAVAHYAWFHGLPFGYGVFGPFIASLLTVGLLIAALFTWKQEKRVIVPVLAAAALLAGLSPLLYVPECFTLCGGFICALLAAELVFSLLPGKAA